MTYSRECLLHEIAHVLASFSAGAVAAQILVTPDGLAVDARWPDRAALDQFPWRIVMGLVGGGLATVGVDTSHDDALLELLLGPGWETKRKALLAVLRERVGSQLDLIRQEPDVLDRMLGQLETNGGILLLPDVEQPPGRFLH